MRERKIELLAISQICQTIPCPQTLVLYDSYITYHMYNHFTASISLLVVLLLKIY